MWTLTRYDDIRAALLDPERFTNRIGNSAGATERGVRPEDPEKARQLLEAAALEQQIQKLYADTGWPTCPTLSGRDEPEHMQLRRLFDHAFRPARVRDLDPFVEELTNRLFDDFADAGRCEWVERLAIPLPLYVIGRQMGVPDEDMQQIKAWTDSWVARLGLMQTPRNGSHRRRTRSRPSITLRRSTTGARAAERLTAQRSGHIRSRTGVAR